MSASRVRTKRTASGSFPPMTMKRRIDCAAEQAVQFMELAALAFPAHPFVLLRIPLSRAMQQQEPVRAVAQIEARNAVQGQRSRSSESAGACSVSASVQSVRRAKYNSPSALDRKWTSSRSISSSMSSREVRSDGTDNQRPKLLRHAFAQRQARNDSRIHKACHCKIDNCHADF